MRMLNAITYLGDGLLEPDIPDLFFFDVSNGRPPRQSISWSRLCGPTQFGEGRAVYGGYFIGRRQWCHAGPGRRGHNGASLQIVP